MSKMGLGLDDFLEGFLFNRNAIWPIKMLIWGIACVGVFVEKGKWKKMIQSQFFPNQTHRSYFWNCPATLHSDFSRFIIIQIFFKTDNK